MNPSCTVVARFVEGYIRAPRTTPGDYEYQQYCDMCGQKIDWEDLANENT
jgi:hypothetical protein